MPRTATVKMGEIESTFDGDAFTSADAGAARILNSALDLYRSVGRTAITDDFSYWPDTFKGMIESIAQYSSGELVSIDPPEGAEAPEGAVE